MNFFKINQTSTSLSLLLGLALMLFLLVPLIALAKGATLPPGRSIMVETALQVGSTTIISGTYVGTVAITEPVQLGVLDLAFDLAEQGNTFGGAVNLERTLVFSGAPTVQGNLTGSIDGITPTFRLDSALFSETVSNQQVERQFSLVGEVAQNGQILQGIYEETITGLTPEPLTSQGLFLLSRPPLPSEIVRSSTLRVQVIPSPLTINSSATIEATLRDGSAQPIANEHVIFSSNLGNISPTEADTDDNGVISATFSAGSTPGLAIITATGGGVTGTTTVFITPPAVTTLTLTAGDIRVPTGGQTSLTITLQDGLGQPMAGEAVELSSTLGSVSPISPTTDANGTATATFTAGPLAGKATVTAQAGELQASVDIGVENRGTRTITLVLGATELLPGGETSVLVSMADQFGQPIAGQNVTLFSNSYGLVSPSAGITDNNGQVSATFRAGTRFGEATVRALSGSAFGSASLLIRDPATAPTLTAVTPAAGPATGGTLVTLTGINFQPSILVYFEPTLCQNITFVSSSELTCLIPPHFPARVDVSVVNPDNQMHRLKDGFNYEGDTVLVDIRAGWNYIGLPLDPDTPYTAESLCDEINGQGGTAVEIQRRQGAAWESHLCGDTATDFPIELGVGYQVRSNTSSTWTLQGQRVTDPVPLQLQMGWNSISIPHTDTYTAESLCIEMASQGVGTVQIDRWYAGGLDTHVCGLPFNNFPIEIGVSYSVKVTSPGTFIPRLAAGASAFLFPPGSPRIYLPLLLK